MRMRDLDALMRKRFTESFERKRTKRRAARGKLLTRPALSTTQILAWADVHHVRTGEWPTVDSGKVHEQPHETWRQIGNAQVRGFRGLPGGSSLRRLLLDARGVRYRLRNPPIKIKNIIKWGNAHYARHGAWPTTRSGVIPDSGGLTWLLVGKSLPYRKPLPKDCQTLEGLFAKRRFNRAAWRPGDLSIPQILNWADDYFAAKGRWPSARSRGLHYMPRMSWRIIDDSLRHGLRGLPGGKSLEQVLEAAGRGTGDSKLAERSLYKSGRYVSERAKR
jgi:hypothetical protein